MAAAVGLAGSGTTRFETVCDVPMAGLLVGLPALCANGLFIGIGKHLKLEKGFYSCLHILLILGFMALARIRRPEGLRHIPPGEFGKVVGLDRAPEVRTLRAKITAMATTGNPGAWMKEISKSWLEAEPEEAVYLYVDGHVRVYNGDTANLPRRFVSREKLCLRGTTDYWVNDALGRPFFVVSKAVTEGLADSLLKDIIPDLLDSVPCQPPSAELEADPMLHRFVVVFDREGATYSLLCELWKHRIGALTYRKNVKDVWPENEFIEHEVPVPGGGSTCMKLAMRDTLLCAGKASIPVTVTGTTKNGTIYGMPCVCEAVDNRCLKFRRGRTYGIEFNLFNWLGVQSNCAAADPLDSIVSGLPAQCLWEGAAQFFWFEKVYCTKESFDGELAAADDLGWTTGHILKSYGTTVFYVRLI